MENDVLIIHLTCSGLTQMLNLSSLSTQPTFCVTSRVLKRCASLVFSSNTLERFQQSAQGHHLQHVCTKKPTLTNEVKFTGSLH